MNPQALTAAMHALAASVTGLNQAVIAQNAATSGSGGAQSGAGAGASNPAWDMLANKFKSALAPLAILGQSLNSATSGFGVLQKSAQVLATSLGAVLLPITTLLATGLVALASVVEQALIPGMAGFIGFVLSIGVPALVAFIDAVEAISTELLDWAKEVASYYDGRRNTESYERILEEEKEKLKAEGFEADTAWWKPQSYELFEEADRRTLARMSAGEGGGGRARTSGASKVVTDALKDVADSFSRSIGPRAQVTGLEGLGRSVQLSALNQDPLDARMLKTLEGIAEQFRRAIALIEGGGTPFAPGGGDF